MAPIKVNLDTVSSPPDFPEEASTALNDTYVIRSTEEKDFVNTDGGYQFDTWFHTLV